jgi:addiction module RelE/StbE family toxin
VTALIWSPQSLRDLEAIRSYIAQDSPLYAELVVRRIVGSVERIIDFPQSGRVVPERDSSDIREIIHRPYRVVYRLRPGVVEVATVFRSSRLFPDFIK